jgi:hypothetical protein
MSSKIEDCAFWQIACSALAVVGIIARLRIAFGR